MRVVCCLGDASKQNIQRFDVVMIQGTATGAAHLPTTVTVVYRTCFGVAGRLSAAPAFKPRIAAQHCSKDVVQVDVADDEQRSVPRRSTRSALQLVADTLNNKTTKQCNTR